MNFKIISVLLFIALPLTSGATSECVSHFSKDKMAWMSEEIKSPSLFIELLHESQDFKDAILAFVNYRVRGTQRVTTKLDAIDLYLGYVERIQNIKDQARQAGVDNLIAQRIFEIQKNYKLNLGSREHNLSVLAASAREIFNKDDKGAFQDHLIKTALANTSPLKLGRDKEVKFPERTRQVRESSLPYIWVPKNKAEFEWIPEAVRNTQYFFAMCEESPQFKKIIVSLAQAANLDKRITLRSDTGDLYLAMISILQNPGKTHRFGLARTLNYLALTVLEMYIRNEGGDRTLLFKNDGSLLRPRTYGVFAEVLFNQDTYENWPLMFQEVLKELIEEDDTIAAAQSKPGLIILPPETKSIVLAANLSNMWSLVDTKLTYLDGQVVDPMSTAQAPVITQPTIINETETWSKAFDQTLKNLNSELAEFQQLQSVVFDFQMEYLKRSKEKDYVSIDDEAFRKWFAEFVRLRYKNYDDLMFTMTYLRKLASLAQIVYSEWHHPRTGPRERQKLVEIVRVNILPPMKNVEYTSLIQRFKRLLFRGRNKVVNYDLIQRIFQDVDQFDNFSYNPRESVKPEDVEKLNEF